MIVLHVIRNVTLPIPASTRRNGTLYLHAFVTEMPLRDVEDWKKATQKQTTMSASIPLTLYLVPEAETFNLLNENEPKVDVVSYGFLKYVFPRGSGFIVDLFFQPGEKEFQ